MDDEHRQIEGKLVAEVTVGSVTVLVRHAPVSIRIKRKPTNGQPQAVQDDEPEFREYESFQIVYYEGKKRQIKRRNTLAEARKRAKEIATRLSRLGPQAEYLNEQERRVYVLARSVARPLGLEVDEVCRRYSELQRRLKDGTPEAAVDFYNDHGSKIRHGASTGMLYDEYVEDLEKRGAGDYHVRDCKRYAGGFVAAFPTVLSKITSAEIDKYLSNLGGKSRSKNNHRDGIIAFYNFAQLKGFLPWGMPHPAFQTTEFRDARTKITSEAQATALIQADDIYLPEQMGKILAVAAEDAPSLLPSLEIKAFSGVRTEELVRLWWVMVAEAEQVIKIPDAVGKIDARRVPILQNLAARLQKIPLETKHERVAADWSIANSLYHAWKRVCKKAGVPYKRNAFRKSYFSYRLVVLDGDLKKVADEGGTSEKMLKKQYLTRGAISLSMAEEWFSL
jgi:hypothetical protein